MQTQAFLLFILTQFVQKKEKHVPIHRFTPQMPSMARRDYNQIQEPDLEPDPGARTQSGVLRYVTGTEFHHELPSRRCISRELELGAEAGLRPRHSNVGHGYLDY